MTYLGRVQNGVIVLEGSPALAEGTLVNVDVIESPSKPRPGSAEAILRYSGTWHGEPGEMDRLLAELREMKWAEVEAQRNQPDEDVLP